MQHAAIRFETFVPPQPPDPVRMDVACFIGFLAQRPGATVPGALQQALIEAFGDSAEALAAPGGLMNRPVAVTSVAEAEALYDLDARLEQRAVVEGGPLAEALPGSGVPEVLTLVIDGMLQDIPLAPLPLTAEEAADRIRAAGLGLEVSAELGPGGSFLRLALPVSHGPGSLAVLPYPTLGFPETRRARARSLPSPMGQALRQFFAMGGRKAVVVSMGPPPVYDATRAERIAALHRLLLSSDAVEGLNAGLLAARLDGAMLSPVAEAPARHGPGHLFGLPDVSCVLLPDLPELVAPPPGLAALQPDMGDPLASFAECLPAPDPGSEATDTPYLAPVLDAEGHVLWSKSVEFLLRQLRASLRDKWLIAALPRAARALDRIDPPQSAFLQLAEGWIRSAYSAAAPERLMAPDATLAGHLARLALTQGTFRSAAALPLAPIRDVERREGRTDAPTSQFHTDLHGPRLTSDLTTSADPAWTDGPVSRLMAMLIRQARQLGERLAFAPSGPDLWAEVRDTLERLMEAALAVGALAGDGKGDGYDVRCDRSTMSQDDLDNGRLVAEVTFRPNAPVARITVRLPLTENPGSVTGQGGPA